MSDSALVRDGSERPRATWRDATAAAARFARVRWRVLLAVAGIAVFAWSAIPREPWIVDDALIYSSYARNAIEGRGLVYGPGAPVEAFSSPLWMLLLVAADALGLHGLAGAKLLGAIAGAATVAVVALARVPRRARAAHAIAVAVLALQPSFAWWSASGLDTPLAVLLVAIATTRAMRGDLRGAAIAGALAAVSRPEGPLLAMAAGAAMMAQGRGRARELLACAALPIPWLAWLGVRGTVYREALAASSAKLVPDVNRLAPSTLAQGREYLVETVRALPGETLVVACALALLLVTILMSRRPLSRAARAAWAALLAIAALLVGFVLYAHGDWMPQGRLLLPAVPPALLAASALVAALGRRARAVLHAALLAALALCVARQVYERSKVRFPFPYDPGLPVALPHGADPDRIPFLDPPPADGGANYYAAMLIHYTRPGDRVLHCDVGQTGFLADDVVHLDPFGLVSRDESLLLRRAISDEDYRARFLADPPVMAFVLVTHDRAVPVLRVPGVVEDILARDYERVGLGPWWGGFDLDIRVRKDALARHADGARWDRWVAHAKGIKFDPPDYLFGR